MHLIGPCNSLRQNCRYVKLLLYNRNFPLTVLHNTSSCATNVLTYLLTPWSRVLLEKLPGFAANQEIPRILWNNPKVHNLLTSARHLSLSWANSIQSPQSLHTSSRSILILSSHLRVGLPNGLIPSGFLTKTLSTPLPSSIRATRPAQLILLDFITRTILGEEYRSLSSSLCNFLHSPVTPFLSDPNITLNTKTHIEWNIYCRGNPSHRSSTFILSVEAFHTITCKYFRYYNFAFHPYWYSSI